MKRYRIAARLPGRIIIKAESGREALRRVLAGEGLAALRLGRVGDYGRRIWSRMDRGWRGQADRRRLARIEAERAWAYLESIGERAIVPEGAMI